MDENIIDIQIKVALKEKNVTFLIQLVPNMDEARAKACIEEYQFAILLNEKEKADEIIEELKTEAIEANKGLII